MEKSSEYLGLLVLAVFAVGLAGVIILLNKLLGPKHPVSAVKSEPFECGMPQITRPTGHFSVKFYLVAMLFILFDVEIVWFFPWAVILREMRWEGIGVMFSFVFVLMLGFVFAWKKGALEWQT